MTNLKDYYAEKAYKELERRKERAELFVIEWGKVERLHKKDGTDFANLKQNFTKGVVCGEYDQQQAKVYIHSNANGYDEDYIDITPTIYSNSEDAKKYEEQGRLQNRGAYLHPFITLTPSEIETAIAGRIEYWQEQVVELNKALTHFDEYASKIVEMREQAKAYIENLPEHYVFRGIMEGR